jgi:hypothetical protein
MSGLLQNGDTQGNVSEGRIKFGYSVRPHRILVLVRAYLLTSSPKTVALAAALFIDGMCMLVAVY